MKRTFMLFAMMMISTFSNAQIIQFADPNFKNSLVNSLCVSVDNDELPDRTADINGDGEININEAQNITKLYLTEKNISDLSGIENFINVRILRISYNKISIINLSQLNNLEILYCDRNIIKEINITNYNNLRVLHCHYNQISKIISNPNNKISILNIENNKFDEFDLANFKQLVWFRCGNNNLKELNLKDMNSLEIFTCGFNKFTNLNLENLWNLTILKCNNNLLSSIKLNHLLNLKILDISHNFLNEIDVNNLNKLEIIYCSNNKLNKLILVSNPILERVYCDSNEIDNLSITSKLLEYVHCNSNKLTELKLEEKESLNFLNCSNNSLLTLYIKGTRHPSFSSWHLYGNDNLQYVCCNEIIIKEIKDVLNEQKINNCEVNSYCSFTPGGKFYTITGETIFDQDENGCDVNDIVIPYLKFNIKSLLISDNFFSDSNGTFNTSIQEGSYSIKPKIESLHNFILNPDSITITFPSTSDRIIQDFCITPKGIYKQVDLSIIPTTAARPGFDAQYKVVMTNKGNQVENGTLYFAYDEAKMDFVLTDVNPSTKSDGLLSWDFTDLLPFETRYYNVTLNVNIPSETPPVNAGDELLITCNILDNVFLLRQEVVGSYDPNDKTCLEGKTITPDQVGEYVHYLIRFENTGNYAAENVVVKDVIDASTFDISTLQITDASHEAWARINGNIVEFIFENIQLPFDDATNDGYICFKIKTKPTLVLGNELKNEANIYFDYNLPILTNKTNTVVAIPVGINEAIGESNIEIFSNPVSDVLKFSGDDKILKVEIFDMNGRLVQVSNVVDNKVNVERFLSGAYNATIVSLSGISHKRFTKM